MLFRLPRENAAGGYKYGHCRKKQAELHQWWHGGVSVARTPFDTIRRDPQRLIFAERFGSPRTCRSLFLLHEAQIADNGEQLLSDGCFGAARKIEKGIKFILVRLHLR